MEQTTRLKRPRPTSLQINIPRVKPIAELTTGSYSGVVASSAKIMSYNYQRPRDLSPGGRRLQNTGRVSDNNITDPYYSQRHGSYASPRSSGVIPISTQTFVNVPPPTSTTTSGSSSRAEPRYDSYSGRPRRSSLVDTSRNSSSTTQVPIRSRPNVVQQDIARPLSPSKPTQPIQPTTREYYVVPASSQEPPRTNVSTHKKLYSVDDGGARLVADVNIPVQAGGERHHRRRDSVDRGGYRTVEREKGGRGYHVNGAHNRPREKSIEDEDAYSYTDPASMYRDTEPRWRETRTRRGSIDRSGGVSRERPVSMLEPTLGTRQTAKEVGPPPSTRGWDKINEIGRTRSVRDTPREVAQSPTRGRIYQEPGAYVDPRDPYYVAPRTSSTDRRTTIHGYDGYEYDNRESRRPERRHSITRDSRADRSVERRGFGIRVDPRNESQTRHAGRDGRGSDESFEGAKYRDSGYGEPHRRETAPGFLHPDVLRQDQEKRERDASSRLQPEGHGRSRQRAYSDVREMSREPRRREDDRTYERDYIQERDRSRVDRPADRERERHHHRRDTDKDRDYDKRDASPRQSGENNTKPGLAQAATGGLAGAAAAFGLTNLLHKVSDKRDKDKDDLQDRDRERDSDRERRREREREQDRGERKERKAGEDRDYTRERRPAASDEYDDRERHKDNAPSLGFAFEGPPEPPRSAPPTNVNFNQDRKPDYTQPIHDMPTPAQSFERDSQRDSDRERSRDNKPFESKPTAEMPAPPIDADEDYRRRMEQVQRELGRSSEEQRASDSDADRERRRREREQRQRDRELRQGSTMPGSFDSGSREPHQNFRDDLSSYASTVGTDLRRRPSILDQPMTDEPDQMAHIIDNSMSDRRENRVRIVDPPTEEEEKKPKGILKKPTQKFPEDPNAVREGVAPLKDATKKGIPPGARWTKIDRRLVNPEALEAAQERFEERLDCVIVLRVLTKEEIQKLADRTRDIRDRRYEEERAERKASRRSDRNRDRATRDEYEYSDSDDEFKQKPPKMLEAPSTAGTSSNADFVRENQHRREREREAEPSYMSGGLGRRDDTQTRY